MYLFNITFVVEIPHIDAWKKWLNDCFLAELQNAAANARTSVYELDGRVEHTPGTRTFSCQTHCNEVAELCQVEETAGQILCGPAGPQRFNVVFFSTMMKRVQL